MDYKWKRIDHYTNPFSAVKDYSDLIDQLASNEKYDKAALRTLIKTLTDKLNKIGAVEEIENFFTNTIYVPDPRRFNKTTKELWKFYRSHIKDCCRLIWNDIFIGEDDDFDIETLIDKLYEVKTIRQQISNAAYEERLNRSKI